MSVIVLSVYLFILLKVLNKYCSLIEPVERRLETGAKCGCHESVIEVGILFGVFCIDYCATDQLLICTICSHLGFSLCCFVIHNTSHVLCYLYLLICV